MVASKKKAVKKEPESTLKTKWDGRHVKITRSKGRVPDSLTGIYTDEAMANRAIVSFYKQGIR